MCGVIGLWRASVDVARYIDIGLSRLQHRGQESAGIAIVFDHDMSLDKGLGLVSHVANIGRWGEMRGNMAIGHVRYSTKGSTTVENAAPIKVPSPIGPIAVSYNGNLVNANQLRKRLSNEGLNFSTTTDTEVIAQAIVFHLRETSSMVEAIRLAMEDLQGAYSLAILTLDSVYAVRDPNGIRPLCLGKFEDGFVIASETCALSGISAQFLREVENGEILCINKEGCTSHMGKRGRLSACVFEHIYMARPDSRINGQLIYWCRHRSGMILAGEETELEFDPARMIVIPIMNTGLVAGLGFAQASKIPPHIAGIKDRFKPQRTFIRPDQKERDSGMDDFTVIPEVVLDQAAIPVDDSIVRGTTKRRLVREFRKAGAKYVHVRIASPPYRYCCYYGIDTADPRELAAAGRTVDEVRDFIGADTLRYLSLEGLYRAIGLPKDNFCDACLTGQYPIETPDQTLLSKDSLEPSEGQ